MQNLNLKRYLLIKKKNKKNKTKKYMYIYSIYIMYIRKKPEYLKAPGEKQHKSIPTHFEKNAFLNFVLHTTQYLKHTIYLFFQQGLNLFYKSKDAIRQCSVNTTRPHHQFIFDKKWTCAVFPLDPSFALCVLQGRKCCTPITIVNYQFFAPG